MTREGRGSLVPGAPACLPPSQLHSAGSRLGTAAGRGGGESQEIKGCHRGTFTAISSKQESYFLITADHGRTDMRHLEPKEAVGEPQRHLRIPGWGRVDGKSFHWMLKASKKP
jgi:hypothetical protein